MPDDWRPFPQTALRLCVPAAGWIARAFIVSMCAGLGCAAAVPIDLGIAAAHSWANIPMERANKGGFGNNSSATGILLLPIVIALILLCVDILRVADNWRQLHGR
jgi:hypothetical protein